mmetsp:Transcript_120007/g.350766  ORF Transcript_120007/g.350766 Transcript_120007/m.350766 type:complete len:254 (-) Transcript_120007:117-878(-)
MGGRCRRNPLLQGLEPLEERLQLALLLLLLEPDIQALQLRLHLGVLHAAPLHLHAAITQGIYRVLVVLDEVGIVVVGEDRLVQLLLQSPDLLTPPLLNLGEEVPNSLRVQRRFIRLMWLHAVKLREQLVEPSIHGHHRIANLLELYLHLRLSVVPGLLDHSRHLCLDRARDLLLQLFPAFANDSQAERPACRPCRRRWRRRSRRRRLHRGPSADASQPRRLPEPRGPSAGIRAGRAAKARRRRDGAQAAWHAR